MYYLTNVHIRFNMNEVNITVMATIQYGFIRNILLLPMIFNNELYQYFISLFDKKVNQPQNYLLNHNN